jgi:hypothetical protein
VFDRCGTVFANGLVLSNLMNKYKILILAVAFYLIMQSANATSTYAGSGTIRIKDKTTFVFKTDKKFVGAIVQVVFENGDVIASKQLEKRKLVIDFNDVKPGAYTIRITKGKRVEEFYYEKE